MSKRRRPGASRRVAEQRFWGAPSADAGASSPTESPPAPIRPSTDPAAVVRSLGSPPLALDASVVDRHLTAVYEEAVRAAAALAAANGLLAADEEDEEGGG
ncbi:MAG TPA: hypothetical protein VGL49_04385 [Acidimicrobiales bacterium]|jgi:hypothetical protein